MAKRAKATGGGEVTGDAIRGNGYDPGKTRSFVDRIEEMLSDIDNIMAEAKDECSPLREDIKAVKNEARDAGLLKRELNAVLSKRRALKRAGEIRQKLSGEQQDNFDRIEQALGMLADTPLGAAAMARTGNAASAHA